MIGQVNGGVRANLTIPVKQDEQEEFGVDSMRNFELAFYNFKSFFFFCTYFYRDFWYKKLISMNSQSRSDLYCVYSLFPCRYGSVKVKS